MLRPSLTIGVALLSFATVVHADDKDWKEVRIATEGGYAPWNYTNPDGTLGGFEIDLANDLCNRMKVKCTISAQSFDSMIPALNAGKFDAIIDDISITPKREEVIAFSIPYASVCYTFATSDASLADQFKEDTGVISLNDQAATDKALEPLKAALKDKTIGTLAAGGSVAFVETYLKGVTLMRQYKTAEARDLDLAAGRVDLVVGGQDLLKNSAAKKGNESVKLFGPCFQGGVVGKGAGVGLRKSDTNLKAMFDKAIREAQADGTITKLSIPVFGIDVTPKQ
ncbi:transporter substrate-binding domain-containing protein [Ensifer aridi]|uniref:transporter substrate-binding domain-containing protein n=1 Tax=Ensifer aridi TaxID=1708715 RepID=UPI000A1118D1|nr:transporter substrate-binding domain-containing protein [Ensifer aridi]